MAMRDEIKRGLAQGARRGAEMTDPKLSEMSADEFADALRAGYRAIILEADEWRPLGEHVKALVDLARKERDDEVRRGAVELRDNVSTEGWHTKDFRSGAVHALDALRRLFPGEKP